MKDLSATAADEATVPIDACFATLLDVERYPSWYPTGVKGAEVLERGPDGHATKVKTTLAVTQGPVQRDFKLHLAVRAERPRLIELRRLPKSSDDREEMVVTWRLTEAGPARTRIEVDLAASLDIPRFLPVGGIADALARGFLDAATRAVGQAG